jgi:hypothetical protein
MSPDLPSLGTNGMDTLTEQGESELLSSISLPGQLEQRFGLLGRPSRVALRRLLDESPMAQPVMAGIVAELTEKVTWFALCAALSNLALSFSAFSYRSSYNSQSPRFGSNDQGVDFEFRLSSGQVIKIEVEQRSSGYTLERFFIPHVEEKLSGLPNGHGIYVFFNGYRPQNLNRVRNWAQWRGIRVVSAPPLPWSKTEDGLFDFDIVEVYRWFSTAYHTVAEDLTGHLGAVVQSSSWR